MGDTSGLHDTNFTVAAAPASIGRRRASRSGAAAKPAAKAAAAAAPAPAVAAAKPAPSPAAAPAPVAPALPAGKTLKLSGVVASVDAAAGTVSIEAHGAKHALRVAQGAKLTKGGDWAAVALKDVAEGDHVGVAYAGDVLASLHVKVMAAASSGKVAKNK